MAIDPKNIPVGEAQPVIIQGQPVQDQTKVVIPEGTVAQPAIPGVDTPRLIKDIPPGSPSHMYPPGVMPPPGTPTPAGGVTGGTTPAPGTPVVPGEGSSIPPIGPDGSAMVGVDSKNPLQATGDIANPLGLEHHPGDARVEHHPGEDHLDDTRGEDHLR